MTDHKPTAAVFPVRESAHNEELRYALRGIDQHCPWITDVWIVGWLPEWCHGVHHIPTEQTGRKWSNASSNILAACLHPDMPERFAWFNDDFHAIRPVADLRPMHRGTVAEVYAYYRKHVSGTGPYLRGMRATWRLLESLGYPEPMSYELHIPMVVERDLLRDCIATLRAHDHGQALHTRTFYGSVAEVGGDQVQDVKVIRAEDEYPPGPWISSTDRSYNQSVGRLVRWALPDKSRWEL